jgi:Leucine Rich repeat
MASTSEIGHDRSSPDIPATASNPRRFVPPLWMLAFVLVLLVFAGLYLVCWHPWQTRARIAAELTALGTLVEYQDVGPDWVRQLAGKQVFGITLIPRPGGPLDRIVAVRVCPAGRPATVPHEIPEDLIRHLKHFPELQRLDLTYTNVTDDWLPAIAELKSLRRLELGHARVGGREFHRLRSLPHLEELNLVYCPVRDEFLDDLAAIGSLKKLNLFRCSHLSAQAIAEFRTARPDIKLHVDHRRER